MNKKKFKEEYDTTAVFNNLTSLLRDEQIINKQKVLLYLRYKTYSELLTKEKEKNKRLEEENKKLNEKKIKKQEEVENKENLNNLNINVDLNQLEFYAHKNENKENGVYAHENGGQDYADENGNHDYAHKNPLYDNNPLLNPPEDITPF
ncbi:hypothetical protein NBO_1386g0001 [Nosema bombycis CQ1]|uniref:Uncharacterized protein n=1 Tax=Nosema bombycis (strain CQ1 / CVCC 102059) TaxID=578461 RepID=R0LZJ9_NOSB1|nr:hypothetical protein NBO_1386g0001 [Nosema bombycis CQ1]|eukprot:EOB11229.1 hypothetical protein NBO_1386g0001 [Nosema bombycis CQ1]